TRRWLPHPAKGVISARASGSVSNRRIVARAASIFASDSGWRALRAQSPNLASSWASVSGFCGEPIGSVASIVTERPSVLCPVLIAPLTGKRGACHQCGIDRRMQRPAAGVWLVAQLLAAKGGAEIAQQHRGVVPVRLIELEKPKAAIEYVLRPGEPGLRQHSR